MTYHLPADAADYVRTCLDDYTCSDCQEREAILWIGDEYFCRRCAKAALKLELDHDPAPDEDDPATCEECSFGLDAAGHHPAVSAIVAAFNPYG